MVRNIPITITLILLVTFFIGCQERPDGTQGAKTAVEATEAYRVYFGEPPEVAGGTCFAMVGFYPLAADPKMVRPIPHFTFSADNRAQLLVSQMLRGAQFPGLDQLFINPFPEGTKLNSVTYNGVTAVANFSSELLELTDPAMQQSVIHAVGHALMQFPGISNVLITTGEEATPFLNENGFEPAPRFISPPEPPQLFQAVLNKNEGAPPGEILVFFDRPVEIKNFNMKNAQDEQIVGEYFTSIFDMAVVVHPKNPQAIQVGDEITVAWQVEDGKRRENRGTKTLTVAILKSN